MLNKRAVRDALYRPLRALESYVAKRVAEKYVELRTRRVEPSVRIIEQGLIAPDFPIDVVYTWVDQEDPDFRRTLSKHLPEGATNLNTTSNARFQCHEELRYSLRSIESFAPWVNHIYIVTNGQVPVWLKEDCRISLVRHEDIISLEYLPTFNSHVIGSCLHRIPGLSEHYIYFNDDVLLLHPIKPTDAFTETGLSYGFISLNTIGNGPPVPHETATEWGAKNARDLILREWGRHFDRRFTHMYHPQRRSVAELCEATFAAEYHAFRRNRFRKADDILCCSFLHHYVGFLTGRTLLAHDKGWYVQVRDASAAGRYRKILEARSDPDARAVVCLNDYMPPYGEVPGYREDMRAFLDAYFPTPSCFEKWSSDDARAELMAV